MSGPRFWDREVRRCLRKRGGRRFVPPVGVSVGITHTNSRLHVCVIPLARPTKALRKTRVARSTKTESTTVQIPKIGTVQMNSAEYFTLATAGTSQFRLFLRDPALINRFGGGEIPTQRAEIAIQLSAKCCATKNQPDGIIGVAHATASCVRDAHASSSRTAARCVACLRRVKGTARLRVLPKYRRRHERLHDGEMVPPITRKAFFTPAGTRSAKSWLPTTSASALRARQTGLNSIAVCGRLQS